MNHLQWSMAVNFFIALLGIVNPLAKIPLWIKASKRENRGVRFQLAIMITLTGAIILLSFLWWGTNILVFFGIDLASFKIGGGIVILLLAIRMLDGKAVTIDTTLEDHE
jgi:multiple antibiotic resistance protein